MSRLRLILIGLSLATSAFAQSPSVYSAKPNDNNGTVTAPEQLRRALPPAVDLTPAQLEARGDELRAEKSYADALDYYHEAIKRKASSGLYNKAGIAELLMLRYEEAKKDFERAAKMSSSNAEAYNNLGVVYYIKRNYRKAIKYYGEAIKRDDNSASFHSNLGTALFSRKEFDKATQEYMRALQIDPDVFERHSNAGVSAHMSSPQDRAHYSYVVAKMFASRGDADRCLLYLKKAIEEGYPVASSFYSDADFEKVKSDPRIISLVTAKPNPLPN